MRQIEESAWHAGGLRFGVGGGDGTREDQRTGVSRSGFRELGTWAGRPDLLDTTPLSKGSRRNLQNRSHAVPTTVARGATGSAVPGSPGFCRKPAPDGQPVVPAVNGCRDSAESARLKQEPFFHRYLRSHFVRVTYFQQKGDSYGHSNLQSESLTPCAGARRTVRAC